MTALRLRKLSVGLLFLSIVLGYQIHGRAIGTWLYFMENPSSPYLCDVWDEQTTYYGANCANPGEEGSETYCREGEEDPFDETSAWFYAGMQNACNDWCYDPSPYHGPWYYSCEGGDAEIFYYYDECFVQCWCYSCF